MKSGGLPIERINALAELDRLGWKWASTSDSEVEVCCPAHDDSKPSCMLNIVKNKWFCQSAGCNAKGDIVGFIAHVMNKFAKDGEPPVSRETVITELATRYELQEVKTLNPEKIEHWHSEIWTAGPLLKALRDRGVTDDDIRSARLGFEGSRITIPVYDSEHRIVNVRKYLPGAPGPQKMRNTAGYAGPHIYQIEQLIAHDKVWLCGGEMKALVAGRLLNPHGIGACSITAGEGAWHAKFTRFFKGKIVYIVMDTDIGGRAAAHKLAEFLLGVAAAVWIIHLPLDPDKYPKGDINDYVVNVSTDLAALEGVEFKLAPRPEDEETEAVDTKLVHAARSENVGRRIRLDGVVQALEETPYIVPKVVGVSCTKDQPNCHWCPVKPIDPDEKGIITLTIKATSSGMLSMVQCPTKVLREATREALRIPLCKVATFTVKDHYDVRDVQLSPQLEITGDNSDHVSQPAMIVGDKFDVNTPYLMTGRVYPHPKNQQAVLLIDTLEPSKDSLYSFNATTDELNQLDIFQPEDDSQAAIQAKLDHIYSDLEANVTHIYMRRDLHLVVDLMYHSVLQFEFDGQQQKGWVNALIVGDSSQGKSDCSQRMRDHYGVGERVDCKTATPAGILGGVQEIGNRWFVTWGVIPMNDKRAVILEELKGAKMDLISTLTDMRSSGRAQVSKIEKRIAHARTRLLVISNSRSNRQVGDFNFGIEIIQELIEGLEDIRRFDVAAIISEKQVDEKEINKLKKDRPEVSIEFTSELCRRNVLWAWTRKVEDIVFEPEAMQACVAYAITMCGRFSDALPLVDKGSMRLKIARLAAALAARLFSTDDTVRVLVKACHVAYVADWLTRMYSEPTFGYDDFSKAKVFSNKVIDPQDVRKNILSTRYPKDLVEHMMHAEEVIETDLQDWCELDRDEAKRLMSFLVRKHALYRVKRSYIKTGQFIELLKDLQKSGLPSTCQVDGSTEQF